MKIAVIDADLIGRSKHRFPNLASMKISGYYKSLGNDVILKLDYKNLDKFDKVFISKVFTDTPIDENILKMSNVEYGGTGFFFDKAPNLPCCIEHHMPDYHLYDEWVNRQLENGVNKVTLKDYTDTSIGFVTRGCFRKCDFCVNKKYDKAEIASPITEFLDTTRKRVSLYDDNFLAYPKWREVLDQLNKCGKKFRFKQGLDIRLMTKEKAELFDRSNTYGDFIFAFDFIGDKEIIEEKLKIWKSVTKKQTVLYVFCGFDRNDKWNDEFWKQDIIDTFERIKILMQYGCIPYIMRFNRYEESPYRGIYITLARWCNQPSFFKKKSFRQFCESNGESSASMRYANEFERMNPEIAKKYYDIRFEDLNQYKIQK